MRAWQDPGGRSPQWSVAGMQTVALIVAAGRGERFGAALPKQYAGLGRQSACCAIQSGVRRPSRHRRGPGGDRRRTTRQLYRRGDGRARPAAARRSAARRRQDIGAAGPGEPGRAARRAGCSIHDAARPLVSAALIDRVLDGPRRDPCRAAGAAGRRHAEAGGRHGLRAGETDRERPRPRADAAGLPLRGDPGGAPGAAGHAS